MRNVSSMRGRQHSRHGTHEKLLPVVNFKAGGNCRSRVHECRYATLENEWFTFTDLLESIVDEINLHRLLRR